ncbi:MAG: HAD hydrolase-like protein, partial [Alkaliphilus sp.]|nr:HAD hydrolase-like protein [Alkaliphilus sp.]
VKNIWDSTKYMISNIDPDKTNEEAFFEDFYERINHRAEIINPILNDFYEKDFNNIREISTKNKYMIDSIALLKQKGYDLVVATNPLFPERAILHRIEWAGLNKDDFIFISSLEKMHYCKPRLEFYEEVLDIIQKCPRHCMMVGNDIEEDMIAKNLGMKTYLIEDHIIGTITEDLIIDYKGNYEDFYEFVKTLD